MTISGTGFITAQPSNNDIRVCGLRAEVVAATQSDVTIKIPALVTETTQADYNLVDVGIIKGVPISDSSLHAENVFDGTFNSIYSSDSA